MDNIQKYPPKSRRQKRENNKTQKNFAKNNTTTRKHRKRNLPRIEPGRSGMNKGICVKAEAQFQREQRSGSCFISSAVSVCLVQLVLPLKWWKGGANKVHLFYTAKSIAIENSGECGGSRLGGYGARVIKGGRFSRMKRNDRRYTKSEEAYHSGYMYDDDNDDDEEEDEEDDDEGTYYDYISNIEYEEDDEEDEDIVVSPNKNMFNFNKKNNNNNNNIKNNNNNKKEEDEDEDDDTQLVSAVTLSESPMTYEEKKEDPYIFVYVPQMTFHPGSKFRVKIKVDPLSNLTIFTTT